MGACFSTDKKVVFNNGIKYRLKIRNWTYELIDENNYSTTFGLNKEGVKYQSESYKYAYLEIHTFDNKFRIIHIRNEFYISRNDKYEYLYIIRRDMDKYFITNSHGGEHIEYKSKYLLDNVCHIINKIETTKCTPLSNPDFSKYIVHINKKDKLQEMIDNFIDSV